MIVFITCPYLSIDPHSGYCMIMVTNVTAYGIVQSVEVKECQRI
jgi:hypothetical protein